jgi:transmembrane sensor
MTIYDLLTDESFLKYCRNASEEDILRWESFIRNNPDKADLIYEAKIAYEELFRALAQQDLKEQSAHLFDKIMQEQESFQESRFPKSSNRFTLVHTILYAAAVVIILMGSWKAYTTFLRPVEQEEEQIAADFGEKKTIQLTDGTIISLNSVSNVRICGGYGLTCRDIYLDGEAFFDVKRNESLPFIVHTADLDIRALGTSFNVKAYPGEKMSETSLIHGSVEVTIKSDHGRKVLLKPNQKLRSQNQYTPSVSIGSSTVTEKMSEVVPVAVLPLESTDEGEIRELAWKENKLIFENETLANIAIMLERWYRIRVEFADEELKNYRFTGTYEKERLSVVLDVLKETKAFTYQIQEGNVKIVTLSK